MEFNGPASLFKEVTVFKDPVGQKRRIDVAGQK